jgi:hypothetical protein
MAFEIRSMYQYEWKIYWLKWFKWLY